ncbi:STAS domain-containing protein [Asanoa sp. NPDC050611]|uniref:STAS domain-containing protein n=1 Tax=Asanoa sp. NPDC050611 TaxID=3157098 RepID=UPI00340D9AF0
MRELFEPSALSASPDWRQRAVDGALVFSPVGDLDLDTAGEFERRLVEIVDRTDAPLVLVDLADVHFIDAGSVSVILRARTKARRRNVTLCVRGLSGVPALVFDALGLRETLICPVPLDDRGQAA